MSDIRGNSNTTIIIDGVMHVLISAELNVY